MAGDWLKIEVCTPDKPEVIGIADILGISPACAFGSLFLVWRWFDQHTTQGNASYVTKVTIDRLSGNAGFADAMVKVGWLDVNDGVVSLPHFDNHNGESAKQRGLTAKRVAKSKAKGNAVTVTEPLPIALPREEKRREEKKESQKKVQKKNPELTLSQFLEDCTLKNEPAISKDDPIFEYAKTIKLPESFLFLGWQSFKTCQAIDKKQADWRGTFRNYVRRGFIKVWAINKEGEYYLTTEGKQLEREMGIN